MDIDPALGNGVIIGRRTVLRLAGTGVAVAGLAACSMNGRGSSTPSTTAGDAGGSSGDLLAMPELIESTDGTLAVTLTAAATDLVWGTGHRYALTYNGTVPGPTLRVRPGDRLSITLKNRLDQPTNLHTHGLHVSPSGTSDNVFVMVDPGGETTYHYDIAPDHPSGTFWYHPHHHGVVAEQIFGGLAGVIVVSDGIDGSRAMASTVERVIVLSDPRIGTTSSVLAVTTSEQMAGRQGDVVLANGQLRPTVASTVGTIERWRLVNASPSRYYRLSIDGLATHLMASDNGRLSAPVAVDTILLTPGQRAEVLVPITAAGTFTLASDEVSRAGMGGGGMGGMGGMGGAGMGTTTTSAAIVLTVQAAVASTSTTGSLPEPSVMPGTLRELAPIDSMPVDQRRTLTLGAMGMGLSQFVIDGRAFDPERIDIVAALGTTEEWRLVNNSMMDHPFHIHVWPFRVVSRSDGPPDVGWRDTVNVPSGGEVVIRMPLRDLAGTTVYHCHILDHEDLGMMGIIDVR